MKWMILALAIGASPFTAHAQSPIPDGFSLYKSETDAQKLVRAKNIILVGEYSQASAILMPLANAGNPEAQYQLAVLHFEGKHSLASDLDAVNWTRRSADQGYFDAQELMIVLPISGFHKLVSHDEAHHYHQKLARKGRAGSQYHMGLRAKQSGDLVTARQWWDLAAAQDYDLAKKGLAELDRDTVKLPENSVSDNTGLPTFPAFADTALNPVGDAAASCVIVLGKKQKADRARYDKNPDAGLAVDIDLGKIAFTSASRALFDPQLNGGLEQKAAESAYATHAVSSVMNKDSGPTAQFCQDNFSTFMADYTLAEGMMKLGIQ